MVMTRSSGYDRMRLVKGSSNKKGKIFDQEGLGMDPIDVQPLSYAPLALLVPYRTFKDEVDNRCA